MSRLTLCVDTLHRRATIAATIQAMHREIRWATTQKSKIIKVAIPSGIIAIVVSVRKNDHRKVSSECRQEADHSLFSNPMLRHLCTLLCLDDSTTKLVVAESWQFYARDDKERFLLVPRYGFFSSPGVLGILVAVPSGGSHIVFHFPAPFDALRTRSAKVKAGPPNASTLSRMTRIAVEPADAVLTRVPRLALNALQWPVCAAPVSELTQDELEKHIARGVQATAEWHLWHLTGRGKTNQAMVQTYPPDTVSDTLVACLLFPFSHLVRPNISHAKAKAVLPVEVKHERQRALPWDTIAETPGLKPWLEAGGFAIEAFLNEHREATPPIHHARLAAAIRTLYRQAIRVHVAFFQQRLPAVALAWTEILLEDEPVSLLGRRYDTPLDLAQEVAFCSSAYVHIRADVAAWAIVNVPLTRAARQAWDERIFPLVQTYVYEWDRCVEAVNSDASEADHVPHWSALARETGFSKQPLVHEVAVVAALRNWKLRQDQRVWTELRFSASGEWRWPSSNEARRARALGIRPQNKKDLARLLDPTSNSEHLPPCLKALMTRSHELHHIAHEDRRTLSHWLLDFFPPFPSTTEQSPVIGMLAEFALGIRPTTALDAETGTNVATFASALRGALKDGHASRGCHKIVQLTLDPPDPTQYACICPFASLATEDKTGLNINPCAQACAKALNHPVIKSPIGHVAWAHETGHCKKVDTVLDW